MFGVGSMGTGVRQEASQVVGFPGNHGPPAVDGDLLLLFLIFHLPLCILIYFQIIIFSIIIFIFHPILFYFQIPFSPFLFQIICKQTSPRLFGVVSATGGQTVQALVDLADELAKNLLTKRAYLGSIEELL